MKYKIFAFFCLLFGGSRRTFSPLTSNLQATATFIRFRERSEQELLSIVAYLSNNTAGALKTLKTLSTFHLANAFFKIILAFLAYLQKM